MAGSASRGAALRPGRGGAGGVDAEAEPGRMGGECGAGVGGRAQDGRRVGEVERGDRRSGAAGGDAAVVCAAADVFSAATGAVELALQRAYADADERAAGWRRAGAGVGRDGEAA